MSRPINADYPVNQGFRSYATAGVVGRYGGTELETLVAMYGNYQPYGHAGADIACPIGTPVYAIADGVVVWADWGYNLPGDDSWGPNGYFKRWGMYKNFPGICTVIWHPQLNKFSIYGHLSNNDIAPVGTKVKASQQIALSGNTKAPGETVGPHLHIAVVGDHVNYSTGGKYIFGCEDPVPYFGTGSLAYAGETITPLTEKSFLMALTDQQQEDVHYVLSTDEGRQILAQKIADVLLRTSVGMLDGGKPTFEEVLAVSNDRLGHIKTSTDLLQPLDVDVRGDLANKGAQLAALAAANGQLAALLAEKQGLTVDDVRAALASAIADGIKVSVTVDSGE